MLQCRLDYTPNKFQGGGFDENSRFPQKFPEIHVFLVLTDFVFLTSADVDWCCSVKIGNCVDNLSPTIIMTFI